MNTPDFPERFALSIYGKTDKANASENNNPDFQAGYKRGLMPEAETNGIDAIREEWEKRFQPEHGQALDDFREWKRGYWASRMARSWYRIRE